MERNEIKKALYRQKPKAFRHGNTKGGNLLYITMIEQEGNVESLELRFSIPKVESEGFLVEMEAKHLIRWLEV